MTARVVVALAMMVTLATGCGSRCRDLDARRAQLQRTDVAPGPHAQVRIPFARANELFARTLADQPLSVPIKVPDLGPFELPIDGLSALAREVRLIAGPPGKLRFAIRLDIRDRDQVITTLAIVTEVVPRLVRDGDSSRLVIGFGPRNLIAVEPELDADAARAIAATISRWLPGSVRDRLPAPVLAIAVRRFGGYLVGVAYKGLQKTLLKRLGDVTKLDLRLPELPVTSVAVRSIESSPGAVEVDITTDLPVRRALASTSLTGDRIEVRFSASTGAEIANWAVAQGHLPRRYTRSMKPAADGEFRPHFDYVADDDARPFKLTLLQERGGCSYHDIGFDAAVAVEGNKLAVSVLDRVVERSVGPALIDLAIWLKQVVLGSVDRTRRVAAHTRFTVGGRPFETRVVDADITDDEIRFALEVSPAPARTAVAQPSIASGTSSAALIRSASRNRRIPPVPISGSGGIGQAR